MTVIEMKPVDPFPLWLRELRRSAGDQIVDRISPYILEVFCNEGCAPSLDAIILHCESGPSGESPFAAPRDDSEVPSAGFAQLAQLSHRLPAAG